MRHVLYFVRGGVASPAQKEEAVRLGAKIRNATVGANDFIERCDAVAGDVPDVYRAKFPLVTQEPAAVVSGVPKVAWESPVPEESPVPDAKLPADMSNKELDAKAEAMGITFPAAVNTKAEKAEYLQAQIADQSKKKP